MLAAEKEELLLQGYPYYEYEQSVGTVPRKKTKNNLWVRRMASLCVLACFTIAVGVGYAAKAAEVAEKNYQLSAMQKELDKLQNENNRLKVDILEAQSLDRVSALAQNKLHMKQPDPQQINFVGQRKSK